MKRSRGRDVFHPTYHCCFFLNFFQLFFPAFLTLLRLTELGFGVGIGLSYKNSTLTTVTIYTAGHLIVFKYCPAAGHIVCDIVTSLNLYYPARIYGICSVNRSTLHSKHSLVVEEIYS